MNGPRARVLLISPPGVPTRVPLLNVLYLGASLRAAGIDVMALDLAAPFGPSGIEALAQSVKQWRPNIIGVTVCTETALKVYRLMAGLNLNRDVLRVAGGPHATAAPDEVLEYGFDVAVRGEGERTLVELCGSGESGTGIDAIEGISWRDGDGQVHHNQDRQRVIDLDDLPSPVDVLDLTPRDWYLGEKSPEKLVPALFTSRGCPGQCTFCANSIHGRSFRYHSVERVLSEIQTWREHEQTLAFNLCDAAFSVNRRRLLELCRGMESLPFRPAWWCEVRADQLDFEVATAMSMAGCHSLLIGAESGDPAVLERLKKGIGLEAIVKALEVCKQAGIHTEVSFMLGLPDETVGELENTLRFMKEIAPLVGLFRPMGIVMPYPGTELYEQHHDRLGFTDWWLDEDRFGDKNGGDDGTPGCRSFRDLVAMHARIEQSLLDLRVIPYSDSVLDAIQACLTFRREHNLKNLTGN